MRRGRRPLTWGADQGLRQVDSRETASHNATGVFAGPGEPSDCQLSLQGFKSSTWAPRNEYGAVRPVTPLATLIFRTRALRY
jgi:hypothetical protein